MLRNIIGHAESRREGYDAINFGATRRTPKRPTAMTIGEIFAWIEATPGQPHAIGRYQFIPKTLRRLVAHLGVPEHVRFTPDIQDFLSDQLLREAGILAVQKGRMSRRDFMLNLAKIWAGLPTPTGNSYYEGYAGNTATITWAEFDQALAGVFPAQFARNQTLQ